MSERRMLYPGLIGSHIQDLMNRRGCTYDELAKLTGMSPKSVSGVVNGYQHLSLRQYFDIVKLLRYKPDTAVKLLMAMDKEMYGKIKDGYPKPMKSLTGYLHEQ